MASELGSSIPSISSPYSLSRAPARAESRANASTTPTRCSFTTSSRSNGWSPARTLNRAHPPAPTDNLTVIRHLQELFPPLVFPEDVALRVITHASWKGGEEGHNGRMAFVGMSSLPVCVENCHIDQEGRVLHREESLRMLSQSLFALKNELWPLNTPRISSHDLRRTGG